MSAITKPTFRIVKCPPVEAALQMAIDEAILESHLNSLVPPTLRLYQFSPPAVSLGYGQTVDQSVLDKIKSAGFEVVRRPTGGRAVLHLGDLTYAFICSSKGSPIKEYILVDESIANAYKQICQALILFLNSFGIEATFGKSNTSYKDAQDCFRATTIGDLQCKGQKIIGSAQLRRKHAVLQHGSIILNQPQRLLNDLLDGPALLDEVRHANLFEITKYEHPLSYLEKELVKSFQQVFNCRFVPKDLTQYEQNLVRRLLKKYKTDLLLSAD